MDEPWHVVKGRGCFPGNCPDSQHGARQLPGKYFKAEGFPGIKMRPYYQQFAIDAKRLFPAYEKLQADRLLAVIHPGHDIGTKVFFYGWPYGDLVRNNTLK